MTNRKYTLTVRWTEAQPVDFLRPPAEVPVNVILSNCVVNLSLDKPAAFREAFRVLRAGRRLAISDVVATAPLPDDLRGKLEAYTGCIAGAAVVGDVERMLLEAGFSDVHFAIRVT
jgi:hypothetical protein